MEPRLRNTELRAVQFSLSVPMINIYHWNLLLGNSGFQQSMGCLITLDKSNLRSPGSEILLYNNILGLVSARIAQDTSVAFLTAIPSMT